MNAMDCPELFNCVLKNPWADTPLETYYLLNPKAKGTQGEKIAEAILIKLGYEVKPRTNSGNDRLVNNLKTEIKFSAASERNYEWRFTFNHIGFEKDWDQIIFVGVNGDLSIHIVKYDKDKLPKDLLSHQQGGSKSKNDDFMCTGENSTKLMMLGECLLNGMN